MVYSLLKPLDTVADLEQVADEGGLLHQATSRSTTDWIAYTCVLIL